MAGQIIPKIYLLVCLCLLVTPGELQEQEERGRRAKCRRPRGRQGDVYSEGCSQFTCTKTNGKCGQWIERPNLEGCCFQEGIGYPMGAVIETTVSNCTETTLFCERMEGNMNHTDRARIGTHSACTCIQEILTEVEENGENIEEIIDLLAGGGGWGGNTTNSSSTLTECQAGWSEFDGMCYKYFDDLKSWHEAEAHCNTEEAFLVSIHSEEEHQFVVDLHGGNESPWLGGWKDSDKLFWWSDGTPWDYTNWHDDQPDDRDGHEDCLHTWTNYQNLWNDSPCEGWGNWPSVCKKGYSE